VSERGVFAVDRGIFNHPTLDDGKPYSRREAWVWLISEAAYRPHAVTVSGHKINLRRGQTAHSLRFMAKAWRWSEPKVRRFLGCIKTDALIDAVSDAGVTVITIRKYNKYQRVSLPTDAQPDALSDAEATQTRRQGIVLSSLRSDSTRARGRANTSNKKPTNGSAKLVALLNKPLEETYDRRGDPKLIDNPLRPIRDR
jgi:hypothetical protein